MYCLEADIVRQKVKISYQIKKRNWRFSCTKGLCTIQMAFVALKALKWALKGQELASDTLKILLANAYHWNPCWKVDDMLHFWLIAFYFHKKTTVWLQILEFFGLTSAPDMFLFNNIFVFIYVTDWFLRSPRPLVIGGVTVACCDWLKIATLLTRALWLAENRHLTDESSVIGWKSPPSCWSNAKVKYIEMKLKCCWNHGKV